jgi:hypothetical protein
MHCGVEVTESSTNKPHHLSISLNNYSRSIAEASTRSSVGVHHGVELLAKHAMVRPAELTDGVLGSGKTPSGLAKPHL